MAQTFQPGKTLHGRARVRWDQRLNSSLGKVLQSAHKRREPTISYRSRVLLIVRGPDTYDLGSLLRKSYVPLIPFPEPRYPRDRFP